MRCKPVIAALLLSGLTLASALPAQAFMVRIRGILVSHDKNTVKINNHAKRPMVVPRNSVGPLEGMIEGKATVEAWVEYSVLKKLNYSLFAEAEGL